MGNLRKEGYDFKKIWFSKKSDSVRQDISTDRCYCFSVNAHYSNMLCNGYIMPKIAWRYLLWKNSILNSRINNLIKRIFKTIF
jgi:hypothetical protein